MAMKLELTVVVAVLHVVVSIVEIMYEELFMILLKSSLLLISMRFTL